MAEKDALTEPGPEAGDDTPSLELPSLFGRRKKRSKSAAPAEPDTAPVEPPVAVMDPDAAQVEPPAEPAAEPPAEPPAAVVEPARVQVDEPSLPVEPPVEPVEPPAVVETVHVHDAETTAAPSSGATAAAPGPPVAQDEPVFVAPLVEDDQPAEGPVAVAEEEPRRRRRTRPQLPTLAASTAAIAVGAVVGLLGCALTFLGLHACQLIRGTSSCGGPGLLVLLVIVAAMVFAGAAMLRLFTVEDAMNVSFLGVGITVAAVLIFLLNYLYEPWMFLVIPAMTALAFLLARWITTRYVEDVLAEDDETEVHDIR